MTGHTHRNPIDLAVICEQVVLVESCEPCIGSMSNGNMQRCVVYHLTKHAGELVDEGDDLKDQSNLCLRYFLGRSYEGLSSCQHLATINNATYLQNLLQLFNNCPLLTRECILSQLEIPIVAHLGNNGLLVKNPEQTMCMRVPACINDLDEFQGGSLSSFDFFSQASELSELFWTVFDRPIA